MCQRWMCKQDPALVSNTLRHSVASGIAAISGPREDGVPIAFTDGMEHEGAYANPMCFVRLSLGSDV